MSDNFAFQKDGANAVLPGFEILQKTSGNKEEDYLQLSGIQHFCFCRRQWALIHIEQLWEENLRTVEGNLQHANAHEAGSEKRKNVITVHALPVHSEQLGISGECDAVEFRSDPDGINLKGREGKYSVCPIEYKHGVPKENNADILQLTAQAMCLEEMLCCEIRSGYLFYESTRRRMSVEFTEDIRNEVSSALKEMHAYMKRGYTPKVRRTKACNACSLKNLCLPALCKNISANDYIKSSLSEDYDENST